MRREKCKGRATEQEGSLEREKKRNKRDVIVMPSRKGVEVVPVGRIVRVLDRNAVGCCVG